jgi:PAS domain S-box-containing protein
MISEEVKLNDLLDNSIEMIHQLDEEGKIRWVNRAWKTSLEIGEEDIKGHHIMQFLTEETILEFQEVFPQLQNGQKVENLNCTFRTRSGKIIHLIGRTIPIFDDGKVVGSQAFLKDVTKLVAVQNELKQIHELQQILMKISNRFINVKFEELNVAIDLSLKEVGLFSEADRAYVFRYDLEKQICSNTHEWHSDVVDPQIDNLREIKISEMPYWFGKHQIGEMVEIADVSELTDEHVRSLLKTEGIQSLLTIPMMNEEEVIGFIGFDIIQKQRTFRNEEKEILSLFCQMLVNVINRMKNLDELNKSKAEIEKINANLEYEVLENTRKNINLSKSIIEQEKLATIGEIAAGIAHDLNTPLGTIKVAADNIRFVFNSVLRTKAFKFSADEFNSLMDRVENFPIEIFLGGLQLRKEKAQMLPMLIETFNLETNEQTEKLAEYLVKCRIGINELDYIKNLISMPNTLDYLDLLNQLQLTCSQLETIKTSSDNAFRVVQEVRSFIKGEIEVEKKVLNLRQNISTVLSVFNYEIKKDIDLNFTVSPETTIFGYDVKLFQLWSNIVKNAIEAMDEQENKYLGIHSETNGNSLKVIFENNGPEIPIGVKEKMFDKFYTTKNKKSGSGLGLSIVNNILKEHNASINVESNEAMTKFIITFVA